MRFPAKMLAVFSAAAIAIALMGCSSGAGASSASGSSAASASASSSAASSQTASADASAASASASSSATSSQPASEDASAASASASSPATSSQPASEDSAEASAKPAGLENGVYEVEVDTDSTMFRLNEASDDKGELTVSDDGMSVHISLVSKNIVNLFAGTAEEAATEGAALIEPTVDVVTYDDGYEEEVYGFDVPVPVLDEPFDVAIIGTKGTWYDHQVTVYSPTNG